MNIRRATSADAAYLAESCVRIARFMQVRIDLFRLKLPFQARIVLNQVIPANGLSASGQPDKSLQHKIEALDVAKIENSVRSICVLGCSSHLAAGSAMGSVLSFWCHPGVALIGEWD